MCLALYHAANHSITEQEFDNAFRNNSDGVGFAYYSKKNNIVIEKGLNKEEMKHKYFTAVEKNGERSPFIVHFRFATHGAVTTKNCHPFRIDEHTIMIHNGVLPVVYDKGETRTDTAVFAQDYLAKLPPTWFDDECMFDMVSDYAAHNKLIIMTKNPEAKHGIYIVNSNLGSWDEDNKRWFSNDSHCTYTPRWGGILGNNKSSISKVEASSFSYECTLCGNEEVLEEMCYHCGSCQQCYQLYTECECPHNSDVPVDMHSLTDAQYRIQFGEYKELM